MLNVTEQQSLNNVRIVGTLNELDIEERETQGKDGKGPKSYVTCSASIKVDQEINGTMYEDIIPIRMISNKIKTDGTPNKNYERIVKLREELTSLAACPEDQPELASRVIVNGGHIEENIWIDTSGSPRTSFQVSTNFMSKLKNRDESDETFFEMSGVVINIARETDMNGEETGRLKIKFAIARYGGRVDVIDLIAASPNAVNFIETNWNEGDTVKVNGAINVNTSTKVWYEEQGFGEPIKRTRTESRRELIVLGGSPSGLEEMLSYDPDSVKTGLANRQARTEELKQKANTSKRTQTKTMKNGVNDFGF